MMKLLSSWLVTTGLSVGILAHSATAQVPTSQWDKTFGGTGYDDLRFLQQTADGGYILGGRSDSGASGDKTEASRGDFDYWVVKLNAAGTKQWDKTFGGTGEDHLQSVQQTRDGGYILGGLTTSPSSGDKTEASRGGVDFWIVKLDANGGKQWDKTIGGTGADQLRSLQQTSDGGYILAGDSNSPSGGEKTAPSRSFESDYWVVKLDANGTKQWDRTLGGDQGDGPTCVRQTTDGGYLVGGGSFSGVSGDKTEANRGDHDYWVVKLDATGTKQWDKTFGGNSHEIMYALQPTQDGNYLLAGVSQSGSGGDITQPGQGDLDYWIVKVNASGNKLWDRRYGGNGGDFLTTLQQTSEGGYILGGHSGSGQSGDKSHPTQGDVDYWVVKLDANGTKQWDKTVGGSNADFLFSLQQTQDNGYILGGRSDSGLSGDKSQPSQNKDFWVVKLGAALLATTRPVSLTALTVSPNPATSFVTVRGAAGSPYQLLNQLGQVVRSGYVSSQPLDVQALPAGLYLLRESASGHTSKLVKE
jgi:hypothetical protein